MAIKYISQNKDGEWKISTSKTGKAIKNFPTQKEAIAYAATIKDTESIMIKRSSGWTLASSWDQATISKAKSVEKHSKAQGTSAKQAKETAVATAVAEKKEVITEKEKEEIKKFSRAKLLYITIATIIVIAVAAVVLYEFVFK